MVVMKVYALVVSKVDTWVVVMVDVKVAEMGQNVVSLQAAEWAVLLADKLGSAMVDNWDFYLVLRKASK